MKEKKKGDEGVVKEVMSYYINLNRDEEEKGIRDFMMKYEDIGGVIKKNE